MLLLAGCGTTGYRKIGSGQTYELPCEKVSFAQTKGPTCGPEAIAQVCKFWGIEANARELVNQTSDGQINGSRLGALREWAEAHGLKSQLYHGCPQDLAEKIAAGMPVIAVLDVNRYPRLPHPFIQKIFWGHAVVVVGFDDNSREVILCGGGEESRMSYSAFFKEWQATEWVTLLLWPDKEVLPEGTPQTPDGRSMQSP
ncbi:MAG: C39 family peptidase [Candidatus Lindowbacteria bacterium]|nr:C39 family peptidase [Candidatus Lindowbacteria bacterium]